MARKKKKKKKSLKQKMENPRFRVNHSFTRWKPLVHRRTRIKLRGSSLLFESRCSAIKVKSCRVFRDRSAFKRISCSRSMVHTFRSDGQSAETRWFLGNSNKKRRGEKKTIIRSTGVNAISSRNKVNVKSRGKFFPRQKNKSQRALSERVRHLSMDNT